MPQLLSLPEELLEQILAFILVARFDQNVHLTSAYVAPRTPERKHKVAGTIRASLPHRSRLALLLVNSRFQRVGTPLLYHTIRIKAIKQSSLLLENALRPKPHLANYIKRLQILGIWAECGEILSMARTSLRVLDMTLFWPQPTGHPYYRTQLPYSTDSRDAEGTIGRDFDSEEFCAGLREVENVVDLTLRKAQDVYLTHLETRYIIGELANAVKKWDNLAVVHIPFRISSIAPLSIGGVHTRRSARPPYSSSISHPSTSLSTPNTHSPMASFITALQTRPKLHTIFTLVPNVWNDFLLRISENPSLCRIGFGERWDLHTEASRRRSIVEGTFGSRLSVDDYREDELVHVRLPAYGSPFLAEAQNHPRLDALIKAGLHLVEPDGQGYAIKIPIRYIVKDLEHLNYFPSRTAQHPYPPLPPPTTLARPETTSTSPVPQDTLVNKAVEALETPLDEWDELTRSVSDPAGLKEGTTPGAGPTPLARARRGKEPDFVQKGVRAILEARERETENLRARMEQYSVA